VAAVLAVREEPGRSMLDTLVEAVGDRYLLVVLDNAEHVLGAAAKLAAALADQEEALALLRATGDNYRLAITLANFGVDELAAGELRAARAHLQEATMPICAPRWAMPPSRPPTGTAARAARPTP
jgi:hypothetical protein